MTTRIGLIVVGDEILSGRRTDQHLPRLVSLLNERGLLLSWSRVVGDDPALLEETFRQTLATSDIVFSTGGIGATPDDLTREAVARAMEVNTEPHPEGLAILQEHCTETGRELTAMRQRLVEFPAGASLIPNPYNRIPGFSVARHHFVPGFPEMAHPMMAWVLDNLYSELHNNQYHEEAVMVLDTYESAVIPIMEAILSEFPEVRIFSLPIIDRERPQIEMGIKGSALEVKAAMEKFKQALKEIGSSWERLN